jgi:hypothetical protein
MSYHVFDLNDIFQEINGAVKADDKNICPKFGNIRRLCTFGV